MTEAEFKRLAAQNYNRVPVVLETCAAGLVLALVSVLGTLAPPSAQ